MGDGTRIASICYRLTLFMFGLFPHEDVSRGELLTLARSEAASNKRQYPQPDSLENDVCISGVAEVLHSDEYQRRARSSAKPKTYEGLGEWHGRGYQLGGQCRGRSWCCEGGEWSPKSTADATL